MITTTPKVRPRRKGTPRRVVGIAPVHMTVEQREDMIELHGKDVINAFREGELKIAERLLSRIRLLKKLNAEALPA